MSKEVTLELLMLELKDMRSQMVTKSDIKDMATKDNIKNMATKDDIKNMATKDDIANLQTDMTGVKGDIANLQTDMTSVKGDIANLQTDMNSVKGDIANLQTDMNSVKGSLSRIESKLDLTYKQTGILSEFRTEVSQRMDQLATKEDLEYLDKKIGEHDREIFKLKNNPKKVNG